MKKMAKFISLSLLISVVCLLLACSGGGDDPPTPIVPRSGEWGGAISRFYVSPDSSQLTASGSTLKDSDGNPYMLGIGPFQFSGACSGTATATFSSASGIPISNLSWSFTTSNWNISGIFTASNTSHGNYSYSAYNIICRGNISSSGTWNAARKESVNELSDEPSVSGKPSQIVDLQDPVTGEVIGIMEFVYD